MRILLLLALAPWCFAEAEKPVCNKKIQGRFWPPEANEDRQRMFELSRKGALEICAAHRKKFRWETVGVNVRQLTRPAGEGEPPVRTGTATEGQHEKAASSGP